MEITLTTGAKVEVNMEKGFSQCRSCGKEILFGKTRNDKWMPISTNDDLSMVSIQDATWKSHFAVCPAANKHRNKQNENRKTWTPYSD